MKFEKVMMVNAALCQAEGGRMFLVLLDHLAGLQNWSESGEDFGGYKDTPEELWPELDAAMLEYVDLEMQKIAEGKEDGRL